MHSSHLLLSYLLSSGIASRSLAVCACVSGAALYWMTCKALSSNTGPRLETRSVEGRTTADNTIWLISERKLWFVQLVSDDGLVGK
jgi:hypothetical protein